MAKIQTPSLIPGQQAQGPTGTVNQATLLRPAQAQANVIPGVPYGSAAPRTVIPRVMGGPFHGTQLGPVQFHPSVGLHFKPMLMKHLEPMMPEAPTQ